MTIRPIAKPASAGGLRTAGAVRHLPDAAGVLGALQRIGYSLEASLADLIDNSVDARASNVLIRFLRTSDHLLSLLVVDDGHGMTASRLDDAMTFGRQTDKQATDLGKYGMGLKSASFAQCDGLTVVTRRNGRVAAQRWTVEGIASGWECERLQREDAAKFLDQSWGDLETSGSGTAVQWDRLDAFAVASGRADDILGDFVQRLEHHLGLHFHRFLERETLSIRIDTQNVESGLLGPLHRVRPLNPFSYPHSGRKGYPRSYRCGMVGLGALTLEGHIWPPRSKLPGYRLGGGRVARRQGFYFYRNDRLIQAGGWNGWRDDAEPHSSLARVAVDLPPSFDEAFALNVQKTGLVAPISFFDALNEAKDESGRSFAQYIVDAVDTYRARDPKAKTETPFVPVGGVDPKVQKRIRRVLAAGGDARETEFVWKSLPADQFFEIDRDNGSLVLNASYRKALLSGRRASKNDLPVIKSLLFLLLRDELGRERMREEGQRWLDICQEILVAAAKSE
jgi:hypothetical protein